MDKIVWARGVTENRRVDMVRQRIFYSPFQVQRVSQGTETVLAVTAVGEKSFSL